VLGCKYAARRQYGGHTAARATEKDARGRWVFVGDWSCVRCYVDSAAAAGVGVGGGGVWGVGGGVACVFFIGGVVHRDRAGRFSDWRGAFLTVHRRRRRSVGGLFGSCRIRLREDGGKSSRDNAAKLVVLKLSDYVA